MPDGLARLLSGVEDDAVAAAVDTVGDRHLMRPGDDLVEQAASGGQCRGVRVVITRDYQDVRRCLRVDVTESDHTIALQHLRGRYLASHGTLASENPARPPDQEAHATFIAGVVLEWAPNATLVVDHVLNEEDIATSSWRVATRMARFADAGVTVLNISFGAATEDDKPPLVLTRAVEVLNKHGVVVVAAAGNHGPSKRKIWPAALHEPSANVVAVGAGTNSGGQFVSAKFSPKASWVDLIAPGEYILSTYKASGYATWSGTSFATAAVSGAIAYLIETAGITAEKAVAWLMTPPTDRKDPAVAAVMDDIGPL